MTRKAANIALVSLITGLVLLGTGLAIRQKKKSRTAFQTKQMPMAAFRNLQGRMINLREFRPGCPALIMYFSPDCEYCRKKAEELGQHGRMTDSLSIIMISPAGIRECAEFAARYRLDSLSQVIFLLDRDQKFYRTFGMDDTPSYLVYNGMGQLIKKIEGDARIEYLLGGLLLSDASPLTGK